MKARQYSESQQLAIDTIDRQKTRGIPVFDSNIMDIAIIDELAGVAPGTYMKQPEETYIKHKRNIGINCLDQFIFKNPLQFFLEREKQQIEKKEFTCDGMIIDSPEAVAEHLEKFLFPQMETAISSFDEKYENELVERIVTGEMKIQEKLGDSILKSGKNYMKSPRFRYDEYGNVHYFMAYALYPELIEKDFSLQADYAQLHNRAVVRAITEHGLPRLLRLDHDMASAQGPLVNIKSLEKIWFPHFERAIRSVARIPGMNIIWHCDGNLMPMIPGFIDSGLKGFQGFQYETGMDYPSICKMKAKDGDSLIIVAGVSSTTTLPCGTPDDIKKEMKWLVENGPETGLFLSASSSITPNTKRENILTFLECLEYYRKYGRK